MKPKTRKATSRSPKSSRRAASKPRPSSALKVANDPKRNLEQRTAAVVSLGPAMGEETETRKSVLQLIADASAPLPLRLTALQTAQAATFSSSQFNAQRPAYLAALRIASHDADAELRQRA